MSNRPASKVEKTKGKAMKYGTRTLFSRFLFLLALSQGLSSLAFSLTSLQDVPLPPGTRHLYVDDPVLPADPSQSAGFGCFESCGGSCNCIDRQDSSITTVFEGYTCFWDTISCNTHPFCRWHDKCYHSCDKTFPGRVDDGNFARSLCYRSCDNGCFSNGVPQPLGGWPDESLNPGPNPAQMSITSCARMLAHDSSLPYDGRITYAKLLMCSPGQSAQVQ